MRDESPLHPARRPPRALPRGEVSFLLADVEGSTKRLLELGAAYDAAQERRFAILRRAVDTYGGVEIKTTGDGLLAAFGEPLDAVLAALSGQRALTADTASADLVLRIGVHGGPAEPNADGTDYVSLTLNEATRVCDAGHGGQVVISAETARLVNHRLPPDVSLLERGPHVLKGLPQPVTLYQLVAPGVAHDLRPLRAARVGSGQPSRERSSFVGRDAELDELVELVAQHPLVTLIGPGGVGKTRLVREALPVVQHAFPEGAWFVPLADISDPSLVANTIAAVMGITETPGEDVLASVVARLQQSAVMITLDNCEHIIDGAADVVATVLAACPSVQFVATSREPLNLPTEVLLPLSPLDVPVDFQSSVEDIADSGAVRLFAERARQVDRSFSVTAANARDIARICQILDGLPLGIELLAPLIRRQSVRELTRDVESRAIAVQGRGRPSRHLTLTASIDWSYRLLNEGDQAVFRRLGVFAGGFAIDGARAVAAGEAVRGSDVAAAVDRLLDKSLVTSAVGDRARFRLLWTIRGFALRQLRDSGEAEATERAHAAWYVNRAESASAAAAPAALAPDYDNLRAALTWSAEHDDELLCRLVVAMAPFWQARGEFSEGQRWMIATHSRARGQFTHALDLAEGTFAFLLGDYPTARDLLNRAATEFSRADDAAGAAKATEVLARIAAYQGDGATAAALFEKALVQFRIVGDDASAAAVLRGLGRLARYQGRYEESAKYIEEALVASMRAGVPLELAETLHDQGRVAIRRSLFDDATDLLQRASQKYREVGDERGVAKCLYGLGRARAGAGDVVTAARLLAAAVDRFRELDDPHGGAWPMGALARVRLSQGDVEAARAMFEEVLRTGDYLDSDPVRMMALAGLAEVSITRGDTEVARAQLQRARALAALIEYSSELADIDARIEALG